MSKNTPTTESFFAEEIFPWIVDTIGMLLDDDSILEDSNGELRREVVTYDMSATGHVNIYIKLPKADAARVIGKQHSTREAMYHLFRGICKNHGFHLVRVEVQGEEEQQVSNVEYRAARRSARG